MDETSAPTVVVTEDGAIRAQASVIEELPKWNGKGRAPAAIAKKLREDKTAFYKKKIKNREIIVALNKTDLFLEEFIRNGGNATEAAWKVYNCKNRAVAASVGHTQLQKIRDAGRAFMEAEGITYGKLLKTAFEKIPGSKTPEWWDRLMKIGGYEDFISKGKSISEAPTIINVIGQAQKELAAEYIEDAEVVGNKKLE